MCCIYLIEFDCAVKSKVQVKELDENSNILTVIFNILISELMYL